MPGTMKLTFRWVILCLSTTCAFAATSEQYIKSHAHEFRGLEVNSDLLQSAAGMKLILIGESHGTSEMPDFTFKFVEEMSKQHSVALGLEFPIEIQGQIESFIKTGNEDILASLDFFKDPNYHSGRGSEAMVRLLTNLRQLSTVKFFCFDTPMSENIQGLSDRDTRMAANILNFIKMNPERTVIVLTGNIHSRLTDGFSSNPSRKNMGSEILRLSNGQLSLNNSWNFQFRYDEGSAWQCWMDKDKKINCGDKTFGPSKTIYATAVAFDRYVLREPEMTDGHLASVFIRKVSRSSPWSPTGKK